MSDTESRIFTAADIAEIKRKNPLADHLRGRGIQLKKCGSIFKAKCPFHEEQRPSFVVYPKDQQYHCYGCDAHGDVIQFVCDFDGIGFREACERLGGGGTGTVESKRQPDRKRKSDGVLEAERLKKQAADALEKIRSDFPWGFDDIWHDSPIRLDHGIDGCEPQVFLQSVFPGDSVIWIGEFYDSNRLGAEKHFRSVNEWLALSHIHGSRTCTATFRKGETCRRNSTALSVPYVVIEADDAIGKAPETAIERELNRIANAALIRWCRDGLGMRLVAIIDTGNKSLHGWFRKPSQQCLDELQIIAPALGIDGLIGKPAQPVRLPGFPHQSTGRLSRLLWLTGKEKTLWIE